MAVECERKRGVKDNCLKAGATISWNGKGYGWGSRDGYWGSRESTEFGFGCGK